MDSDAVYVLILVRLVNSRHIDVLKKWGVDAPRVPSEFHADLKKMAMAYEKEHGTLKV